jgi:hypothetical protein
MLRSRNRTALGRNRRESDRNRTASGYIALALSRNRRGSLYSVNPNINKVSVLEGFVEQPLLKLVFCTSNKYLFSFSLLIAQQYKPIFSFYQVNFQLCPHQELSRITRNSIANVKLGNW